MELPAAVKFPFRVKSVLASVPHSGEHEDRLRHSLGKGYADLARMRSARLDAAPDLVAWPESPEQVSAILRACARDRIAVVPFGGGTSVVGGVEADRGELDGLLSLDLAKLSTVEIDHVSRTARLGAGLRGPQAEAALAAEGFTLGHFPQSFEYATIGGFAATRSAGQASNGYGRFDSLVSSARMITPSGTIETPPSPHTAAGPSLREIILGSEGAFGVIPEVTVRVRPEPEAKRHEVWFAESFDTGMAIVKSMAQDGISPDVVRLSDETETRISLGLSGPAGAARPVLDRYLRLRGAGQGSMIVLGFEGDSESVRRRRALAARAARADGAVYVGQKAGRSWEQGRYQGPYLRDLLIDRGLMVETLETAHTWTELPVLHAKVSSAIQVAMERRGTPGTVFCHLSHSYPDGASLYFTFLCRADREDPLGQWQDVKRAASETISRSRATITHHHGVGRDHLPWMRAEQGELGIEALAALKERFDPAGILNPGKLLPPIVLPDEDRAPT